MKPAAIHSPMRSASQNAGTVRGPAAWSGATLTEILMAILIVAIGIVSVFTLFPISVLRTIQATQQTNSKILTLNTVEILKASPTLLTTLEAGTIVNPPTGATYGPVVFRGEWRPRFPYSDGDVVVPTTKPGQLHPTPLVVYRATVGAGPVQSDATEPNWQILAFVVDGNSQIIWQPININGFATPPAFLPLPSTPISYVIDPLGWNIGRDEQPLRPDIFTTFGNKTDRTTGVVTPFPAFPPNPGPLLRIHGGMSTTPAAQQIASLLDNWEQVTTAAPTAATSTSITFGPGIDLSAAVGAQGRVSLTSSDGTMTSVRAIQNIAGQVVNLAEAIPPRFPLMGGNPDVGTARIEVRNRRYTWFLTLRNNNQGDPEIKCVVVFNRNFAGASEHVYDANFGNATLDLDGDGFADGDLDQDGIPDDYDGIPGPDWNLSGQIVLRWTAAEPEPLLKPSNWLFDARDVSWYRILSVFKPTATTARVDLDRSVVTPTIDVGANVGRAMLMPGIVEVFDL